MMEINEDLRRRQLKVIPHLLKAPSIEDGCRRARVSKSAVCLWLQDETFREELRRQREQLSALALETLKASVVKAALTLVKHLDSEKPNISIRAAESIIDIAQRSSEAEDLDRRIQLLEERASQRK